MGCSGSKDESEARAANAGQKAEAKATPNGIVMKPDSDILSDSTVQITLDANKTAAVKSLFGTWDIDSTGKLELAAFTGVVMKVGPHQTKILSRLTDMDIDKDGFVTKEVSASAAFAPMLSTPAHTSRTQHARCAPSANAGVAHVVHRDGGYPQL